MEIFNFAHTRFTLINLIDILLVVLLAFQLFKLLKGSLAFSIMIGLITIFLISLLVHYFEMPLLQGIFDEFTKVGIIAVLIVFQQEIRKFLLIIGKNSFLGEGKSWWHIFPWKWKIEEGFNMDFQDIVDACEVLAQGNLGAILVFPKTSEMKFIGTSGEVLDAQITKRLIISIFTKNSPLHDGAMIISKGKIKAVNCVLPLSDNPLAQNKYGLRHLAAAGITEQTDAICLVVSEEKGSVSFVKGGKIEENLTMEELVERMNKEFARQMVRMD